MNGLKDNQKENMRDLRDQSRIFQVSDLDK